MSPLTLLYTHNLRGDLSLLPRLHTFIRRLKALPVEDDADVMLCPTQPDLRRTLLVDAGNCCAPDVWHCAVTGGRSTLIALDAMGYDAANVSGILSAETREKLADTVRLSLVDADHPYNRDGVLMTSQPPPSLPAPSLWEGAGGGVCILFPPVPAFRLDGNVVHPQALAAGEVGAAHLSFVAGKPYLIAHHVHVMPPNTPPDPTIAGAVDFVTGEARYYEKKRAAK